MDNRQALGYMLLACKSNNIEINIVKNIFRSMCCLFDVKTEDEAESQGFNWYYSKLEGYNR